ncbi:sigma-70 family RNA polymerase sigma factor [Roseiconus nitratireducens]|uniref:Sigma-70 family RNA polymerase sigma factor n=1 Tax=Roseiconus nitratireducens TaxID=2605748 RepID=A0A5M6D7B3_9BACT|nr:sigma-70 family RNA polymerase sigma factor [Roseiconus nitratireducens]KAA5541739.1 sigma-70 family RNA polymerase sigma factor [Roseiconus nitratireducens]
MKDNSIPERAPWPEQHRDYLHLLGRAQLDPELIAKIDLSGIVQTTMLEAYQTRQTVPDVSAARLPWLRRVFMNNLLDELRKLRTQKRRLSREWSIQESIGRSTLRLEACLAAEQTSPSETAARNEMTHLLLEAIAELPEGQREAIELHHLESLPLAEIARRMNRPKGAVAALIYRGMKSLKSSWLAKLPDGP